MCVCERVCVCVCVCVRVCRASVIFDKWRLYNGQYSGTSSTPTLKSHLLCLPALGNDLSFLAELLALFTDSVRLYPMTVYSYSLIRTQGMCLVRKFRRIRP